MAVATALLIGFLAGLLAFKVKNRWCPSCGDWTLGRPPIEEDGRPERRQSGRPERRQPERP